MAQDFKILIIKFGALGDVVRTSYILEGLNKKYKNIKIDWLTSNGAFDLLRFNPYISTLATKDFLLKNILNEEYDLVISLDDEIEVLEIVKQLKTNKIFGAYLNKNNERTYSQDAGLWFDMGLLSVFGKEKADELKKQNNLEHNEIFAKMLDIEISNSSFYNSFIIEEEIETRFNKIAFKIGLNSGSGGRWESKKLPINETIKLIKKLLEIKINDSEVNIYLLGGEEENDRNTEIFNSINDSRVIDTGTNNSLLEFAAIIKNMDYVISSDSLALHLTIAQNIRNLSFYAPTSAAEIGTFGLGVKVVSTADDYCSYKKDADNSSITADKIYEFILKHLEYKI